MRAEAERGGVAQVGGRVHVPAQSWYGFEVEFGRPARGVPGPRREPEGGPERRTRRGGVQRGAVAGRVGHERRRPGRGAGQRSREFGRALRAAAAWPTAFVADAEGDGTTLYTATPGAAFRPAFGLASRARHAASGAVELVLDGIPGLRRDVDTPSDLRGAAALGLGRHSAPLAAELLRCAPRGR